jgi:hypothetical protein
LPGFVTCRVDYGLALGTNRLNATTFAPGLVGIGAYLSPLDVDAIAVYAVATSCPSPVRR